jgi:hypothetical protein
VSAGIVCLQGIRRLSPPAGSAALPSVTMPRRARPVNAQSVPTDPFTASVEVRTTGCVGDGRREEASLNRRTSSLSGFGTQPCFPRIAPATCANNLPLETAGDRCEPLGSDGMWTKRGPGMPCSGAAALRVSGLARQRRLPPAAPSSEPRRQPPRWGSPGGVWARDIPLYRRAVPGQRHGGSPAPCLCKPTRGDGGGLGLRAMLTGR